MGPPGTPAEGSRTGGRILIVDDQDDLRMALQTLLSLDGWDTEEAASGEEAVTRVDGRSDFDALVVDYKMPDLDGIEVARRIRGSGFERPIIICSAYLNPEIEREASALRARTVSKDDLGDLRETIRRQVGVDGPEESEQAFRPSGVGESSDAAIVETTLEGIVESWNRSAERIYGYSAEEMVGRPLWQLLLADQHNDLPEILQKVGSGERIDDHQTAWETKDGRLIDVSLTVLPVRDRKGNVVGASTSSRSVTQDSEAKPPPPRPVSSWLDRLPAGPLIGIAAAVFAAVFALQVAVDDAGAAISILYNLPVALLALRFGLRGGLIAAAVAISLSVLSDLVGAVEIGPIGYVTRTVGPLLLAVLLGPYADSLRGARAGRELQAAIAANMAEGVALIRARDAMVVYVNEAWERMFGYRPGELVGKNMSVVNAPTDKSPEEITEEIGAVLRRDGVWEGEIPSLRKDGTPFWSEASVSTFDHPDHGTVWIAAHSDITERKRGQEAQSLAAIVESSEDAIVTESLEGTITNWNKGAERLYGYPASEVVGKPIALLIPKERVDELPEILERVSRGERVDHYETVRRAKDGRRLDVSLTVSSTKDADGRISGASTVARDISERKDAERERRRLAAELEQRVRDVSAANSELEAFSYTVSHDLRAPLRAIDGFSRAVIEDYGDKLDEEGRGLLEQARAGSQRMGRLIDELLTLSQLTRREFRPGSVDLSALANKIGCELQAEAPERHVDLVIEDGLVTEGDSALLAIALRNLLGNAWKFTAKRTQPRIELRREAADGRSVYVVRDNGAGFDMRYAEKLFLPFERLHREDEFAGMGVGLATVARVVRRHGGTVWAEGRVDEGAAFFFDLPEGESE